jgi:hypothetical protein
MVNYSVALPQLQQFQTPNRLAMAQQAGALQVQQAQLAKVQQEMDAQNKLRSLDRNSPEFVNQLYALDPAKGQAFEKGQFEMAEAKRKRGEASTVARAESQAKVLDNAYAPFTRLVNNVQSPNDAAAFVTALYSHPVLGAEAVKIKPVDQAIQDSQREFAADPDKWRLLHGNLDGKTIYQISQAATAPKIEKIDLGGAIKFIDMNPKSATFRQEMGDFTKTPVPRATTPEQTSGVVEPQVNNLAPSPTTSAFDARAAGPVQLAMLGGGGAGVSPLIQMARPMPSDGGVLTPVQQSVPAPTRAASRRRPAAAGEDGETPAPATPAAPKPLTQLQDLKMRTDIGEARAEANESLATVQSVLDAVNDLRSIPDKDKERVLGLTGEYTPNITGAAKTAQTKLNDIKGQVTAMAKAAAGSIGSMAVQEWDILANQIATLQAKNLDAKTLNEQLNIIEHRAKGLLKRTQKNYNDVYGPIIKDSEGAFDLIMPEPRKIPERGAAAVPRKGILKAQPQSAPANADGWTIKEN